MFRVGAEGRRAEETIRSVPRLLSGALQKVWVFRFFDPEPGGPPELSVGLPGASGGLPEDPGT